MKNFDECNLSNLKQSLDAMNIDLFDFFNYLRQKYICDQTKEKSNLITIQKGLNYNKKYKYNSQMEKLIRQNKFDWGDINFHLKYRVKTANDLNLLLPNTNLKSIMDTGYNLSILPLNIVINNKDLLNKYIPKLDFFKDHFSKRKDPYSIFVKKSRIYNNNQYIASQKFKRTLLMNITGVCPIGCVGCYKGEFTRVKYKPFYSNLAIAASKQAKSLVNYLNNHNEIKSVIISGGEPLLLSNNGIKKMLNIIKKAKYLSELRICTGVIFQGLPFRINKELVDIFVNFENETGIKLCINAHLSHSTQITPEAIFAVKLLTRNGFIVNSQVPLQNGVNIFHNDYKKTIDQLSTLAELQGICGIRPYKYILHMNSGSLEYSVSLEFILRLISDLKYRVDHPFPETWQPISISILCKEGNILLSPQLLFLVNKKVIKYKNSVIYQIPVPLNNNKWKIIDYIEPIIPKQNDNPDSLEEIKKVYFNCLKTNQADNSRDTFVI